MSPAHQQEPDLKTLLVVHKLGGEDYYALFPTWDEATRGLHHFIQENWDKHVVGRSIPVDRNLATDLFSTHAGCGFSLVILETAESAQEFKLTDLACQDFAVQLERIEA